MVNERTRKVEQVQKLVEIKNQLTGLDEFNGEVLFKRDIASNRVERSPFRAPESQQKIH